MDLMLGARDGVKLAATYFDATPPFRGALLLNGGTGIPRQFYAPFASHLAGRGFTVLSYDYRGIGGSEKPAAATMKVLPHCGHFARLPAQSSLTFKPLPH